MHLTLIACWILSVQRVCCCPRPHPWHRHRLLQLSDHPQYPDLARLCLLALPHLKLLLIEKVGYPSMHECYDLVCVHKPTLVMIEDLEKISI